MATIVYNFDEGLKSEGTINSTIIIVEVAPSTVSQIGPFHLPQTPVGSIQGGAIQGGVVQGGVVQGAIQGGVVQVIQEEKAIDLPKVTFEKADSVDSVSAWLLD